MSEKKPPSRRYSRRRDDILAEALRVFAEHGLESTGIKEIATSLGLTHPALYHYFRSKEQLVFEAVAKAIGDEIAALEAAVRQVPAHPALQLYTMARAQVHYEIDDRAYIPFVNAFLYGPLRNAAKLTEAQRAEIQGLQRKFVDLYRLIIEQGQQAGAFVGDSPTIAAFGVLGILSYAVFWYRPGGKLDAAATADMVAAQAVRSISRLVELPNSKIDN